MNKEILVARNFMLTAKKFRRIFRETLKTVSKKFCETFKKKGRQNLGEMLKI